MPVIKFKDTFNQKKSITNYMDILHKNFFQKIPQLGPEEPFLNKNFRHQARFKLKVVYKNKENLTCLRSTCLTAESIYSLTGWPEEIMYPSLNFMDLARCALNFPLTITYKVRHFKTKNFEKKNNSFIKKRIKEYLTALGTTLHNKPQNTIAGPEQKARLLNTTDKKAIMNY